VRHAIEAGCDLHVSKPVKKATLLAAIAEVVEHSENWSEPTSNDGRNGTSIQE